MKSAIHADLDAFHSGFQACAKEVLQYLSQFENWTTREQRCTQLINHLHKVLARFHPGAPPPPVQHQLLAGDAQNAPKADSQTNCVPVIQRTQGGEFNENDTDTDSGYGGEAEKSDGKDKNTCERNETQKGPKAVKIKQEFGDERAAKRTKINWPGAGSGSGDPSRSDLALINSLMGISGVGQQTPICMPFYFINPSAAAPYMPLFDKSNVEKYVYPAAAAAAALTSPFPWLYPVQASAAAAAAAAAFPGLSSHFGASINHRDSLCPDSDGSHEAEAEAEAGSAEEPEESDDGEAEASEKSHEMKSSPPHHLSACGNS